MNTYQSTSNMIKIVECPRDAMQGMKQFIPTAIKIEYLNKLLEVGFHTLDFGSFVSPKAIPQMRDTAKVLEGLKLNNTKTALLAIVANKRGAQEAAQFNQISYLGYPFSISEEFQQRNTNASIEESLKRVADIQNVCVKNNKQLVVYLSMAFGNPYGEEWSDEIAIKWSKKLVNELGIRILSLSDTIGVSNPKSISYMFSSLITTFPEVEFGAHLHTLPINWKEKVDAAFKAGCKRFDGALRGYGGCPMAKDELTGNMPTENMIQYFNSESNDMQIDQIAFREAYFKSLTIFPN